MRAAAVTHRIALALSVAVVLGLVLLTAGCASVPRDLPHSAWGSEPLPPPTATGPYVTTLPSDPARRAERARAAYRFCHYGGLTGCERHLIH